MLSRPHTKHLVSVLKAQWLSFLQSWLGQFWLQLDSPTELAQTPRNTLVLLFIYESLFPQRNKTYKKGHCDFLSHNSDYFFLTSATFIIHNFSDFFFHFFTFFFLVIFPWVHISEFSIFFLGILSLHLAILFKFFFHPNFLTPNLTKFRGKESELWDVNSKFLKNCKM